MALDQYGLSIQLGRKMVDMFKGGDEKYNHLDKEEVAKVEKAIQEHSAWMDKNLNALATQKKWEDPAVTISQVNQTVEMKCRDAMSFGGYCNVEIFIAFHDFFHLYYKNIDHK